VPAKGAKAKETANFIVDLYDAHDDCHTKVGAIRSLVGPSKK